ncbi:MAG: hypothetical protein NW224_27410 [Leptolyngbyaceae cyanobacterium bins.302]|nr:hypothetical protein [Leptolyngbyaceae cyanobacterium bins.302]
MITNYTSVMYSLLLAMTAIAFSQTAVLAQPSGLHQATSSKINSTSAEHFLSTTNVLTGKPGLPRRRVGGGSRLY